MLSVTNKLFKLSVITLNAFMLNAVMLSVVMLNVIILSVVVPLCHLVLPVSCWCLSWRKPINGC